jgi:hypothetical protein
VGTTEFGYLFTDLAGDATAHLPAATADEAAATEAALEELGRAMVDQPAPAAEPGSRIPPVLTSWGQFVDHDLTADSGPALDLGPVYGGGPYAAHDGSAGGAPDADPVPYDGIKLRLGRLAPVACGVRVPPADDLARDLPRADDPADPGRHARALVGDERNDDNLPLAQLHVAFLRFHNAAVDWVRANEPTRVDDAEVFLRARDLTRWTYQWLTIHDYLAAVTLPGSVERELASGGDLLGIGARDAYLPLEFSAAAFRFGQSTVRGAYDWNRNFGRPGGAGTASFAVLFRLLGSRPAPLPADWTIEWARFVDRDSLFPDRFARPIGTHLTPPVPGGDGPAGDAVRELLRDSAGRILLRGFRLGLPTGQAVAARLGVPPLTPAELTLGGSPAVTAALAAGGFLERTPLWFYVLKEAEVRAGGETLGSVGSRIVAATVVAQVAHDPSSYLGMPGWTPCDGVRLPAGTPVRSVADFLRFAGVL